MAVTATGENGLGTVTSPLIASPLGAAFVEQASENFTRRFGLTSSLNFDIARNNISVGAWYENAKYLRVKAAYDEPSLVQVQSGQAKPVDGRRRSV